ncbi:hypothetical protein Tco_0260618 [Tanacetum coccineum]
MKAIPTPTKKGSITTKKNILSDSNEALKFGESISLNEAKIAEEEQREQEKTDKIIFCNRFLKAQVKDLVLNQRFSMSQRANPQAQVKELVLHQSDDERTESEREVAESDKADDETSDEKEVNTDEEEHVDDETANDEEESEEEKVDNEQARADQTKDAQPEGDQTVTFIFMTHKKKTEFPPLSSSLSLSFDYGNQFLNVSTDVSLVGIIIETADTKINSVLDVLVQQEIPFVQQAPLLDVLVSVIPIVTTQTPSTTPPITEIQATTVTANDSSTMLLRLFKLERKVEALSKVDHSKVIEESVQANVCNEVRNQIPKFLPKAMSEFVNPRIESTVHDVL